MKLRQISFKLVSLAMVFAILFGVSATTISAINVDVEDYIPQDKIDEIDREAIEEEVAELVATAKLYAEFVAENYEEMYASAHTSLRNDGTIAKLNAALIEAMKAVYEARLEIEDLEVESRLAETKELVLVELALTEATLAEVKNLVNHETITEETIEQLEVILGHLEDHLATLGTLGAEFGGILLEDLLVVLDYALEKAEYALGVANEYLEVFAKEAYAYLLEKAPVLYEQLVNALTEAVAYYSHEGAKLVYNWLINNPEKVIEFFDTYGDDIADLLAEYSNEICCVLGYVGYTYGEEILDLVLENADVIIPAVIGWFEIHGDLVWDLIVVYFQAIVEYYNLGLDLDFTSPEGIHQALNKVVGLLGDLLDMIIDGVYDYVEALGIIEKINAELARLNAYVTDLINAKLDELAGILDGATEELKETILEQVAALEEALKAGVKELGKFIYDAVSAFVNDAIRGEFTPTEDTYYVSVNGGEALYADLLAAALSENLESDITLDKTTWGAIDYDMLAKADLVTIGFDQNEITDFAVAQLLGYVNDLIDVDIRESANDYVASVFVALENYYAEVQAAAAGLGFIVPDFDFETVEAGVNGELNGLVDMLVGNEAVSAEVKEIVGEELFASLEMVNGLLADKDAEELDWSKYIPESELYRVDELRAKLRAELLEQGIPETFSYDVEVLELVFENYEALGLAEAFKYMDTEIVAEKLASVATYTFSVPVVDSLVFAIESYIYSNVEFQYNYGKLVVDLYNLNPDATVILLGHYNALDFDLSFGGESLDLSEVYSYVAGISSVQPFAYALLSEKVAYVDISDAETYYEAYVNAGVDNNLVNFILAYLDDSAITDVTVAGHNYIYEQIMNILTIGCEHVYDNACDDTCNKCGAIRDIPGHEYENGVCIHCGHRLPTDKPEHIHYYDDCNDADCNGCGELREVVGHVYDNCEDTTCYKCGATREPSYHEYDDCDDAECNHCGMTRPVYGHNYTNACDAECNACGLVREVEDHVYSGCTDANCNVCGLEREASAHVVDNCADNVCNVCGQNVAVKGHRYGDWTITVEPTRKTEGSKTRTCTGCGLVETKAIAALGGVSTGAVVGVTGGSVVVAAAAGFAIFWFLVQKKSFAELLALLGKGGAEAAAAGATEAAAEGAAEATAEATAEAAAEAAEETVAE